MSELQKAQDELAKLTSEQALIPTQIASAAMNGDGKLLLKLQARADELPAYLFAAQAKQLKLKVGELEARKVQLHDERAPMFAAVEEAARRVEDAKAELMQAQDQLQFTKSDEFDLNRQIGQTRVQLDNLIASHSKQAPIVRSKLHAA
jgi:chromosome segregation ATPase